MPAFQPFPDAVGFYARRPFTVDWTDFVDTRLSRFLDRCIHVLTTRNALEQAYCQRRRPIDIGVISNTKLGSFGIFVEQNS